MFTDLFTYSPPEPDDITRAVESYQRVACARFTMHLHRSDPRRLPLEVTGEELNPTSRQLHAEVRALRHLTAIQRTLRDFGGALFRPDSPVPPIERIRIVDRRLDAIEEAFGDSDSGFQSDFQSSESVADNGFYVPPEIEDLLSAVDCAQKVFAARADLLDKRRLKLSSEDFLLEITALRDLTAVIRTLRRMSAKPLPEDEPLPKPPPSDQPPASHPSHKSHPSYDSPSADAPPAPSRGAEPARRTLDDGASAGPAAFHPSASSNPVDPVSSSSTASESSEIRDFESDESVAGSSSPASRDLRLRSVPRIPEVRAVLPAPRKAPTPDPSGSPAVASRRGGAPPTVPRRSAVEKAPSSNPVPPVNPVSSSSSDSADSADSADTTSDSDAPLPDRRLPLVLSDSEPPPSNSP